MVCDLPPGGRVRKKPGCGRPVLPLASSEALGQVPGGSGLGVNAEDHGSWPMRWSFLNRATDVGLVQALPDLRMGLCSMQERASREGVRMPITQSRQIPLPDPRRHSVMCIVDRTIIRSISKLRMWVLCIVDPTIIRNICKLRIGLCSSIWKLRMWALCIVDRTIIRNICKLRMGLCSMQERASPSITQSRQFPCRTRGGKSVQYDIRNIWTLRMGLCSM
jgi:hypothetical protein